jgi:hypothetical protein
VGHMTKSQNVITCLREFEIDKPDSYRVAIFRVCLMALSVAQNIDYTVSEQ